MNNKKYILLIQIVIISLSFSCQKESTQVKRSRYNIINSYSNGVFISLNTKSLYRDIDFLQFNNFYIDNSDKLDKLALGIYGISMLKIKNGLIIGSKSLNSDDLEKGFNYFFVKPYQIAK